MDGCEMWLSKIYNLLEGIEQSWLKVLTMSLKRQ